MPSVRPRSVVVHDRHAVGPPAVPSEHDPPLIVDPDAVLPFPITLQGLELIARGHPKVLQTGRGVEHEELPQGCPLNPRVDPPHALSPEQGFRLAVPETGDHAANSNASRE